MSLKEQIESIPEPESQDMKELRQALMRMQKQLRQAKERTQDLVDTTQQAAYDAMLTMGKVQPVQTPEPDKRKTKGEVAFWPMTDWQGAKRTTS